MNILILSCKTGGGHDAAAFVLREAAECAGHTARVMDHLSLHGPTTSGKVGNAYVRLVQHAPLAFGAVYCMGLVASRLLRRSPVYWANARIAPKMHAYLAENPCDVIIATHLFPAEMLAAMRREGMPLPVVIGVMTDYTCIPFWQETTCDWYVIPHESLRESFVQKGMPAQRLVPLGIPTGGAYAGRGEAADARAGLGLLRDVPLHLIVGGSMGAGNLRRLTDTILRRAGAHVQIAVICGNNQRLADKLGRRYAGIKNVRIIGHTDDMPLYMRACDVIYTKPGGLTSTEAAAMRVPLVLTQPIPGNEITNRRFFLRRGMAVSAGTAGGQVEAAGELLASRQARDAMARAQAETIPGDAAQRTIALAQSAWRERMGGQ